MKHLSKIETGSLLIDRAISIENAVLVANGRMNVRLTDGAYARCAASHDGLQRIINENRHVYGITTGFGPLANRLVSSDNGIALQQNLIHHLASGVGPNFRWAEARAIVLARLMSVVQGASGASASLINMLVAVLNSRFAPAIPCRGTVGASGDLTPLAHVALCLQGRGNFLNENGTNVPATVVLSSLSLPALSLADRDGLALVNGTSAMTGLACFNTMQVTHAIHWSMATTALMAEVLGGRIEAWHAAFGMLRPHAGQIFVAEKLREHLSGSEWIIRKPISERVLTGRGGWTEDITGQDAYSLRCAPQVIGAVFDLADWHKKTVQQELCSVTDNPIFPSSADEAIALHGGNFMGQHIGLASDALAGGIAVLAGLVERQIARLTDEKLNNGLSAFLHQGQPGLNSGLMGAQVTATALLAEIRSVGPSSIHSISTNGANQDVVSMGTIAARLVRDKLVLLSQIQAIMCIAVAQAMDIRISEGSKKEFSPNAKALRHFVRKQSEVITTDRPLGQEIEMIAAAIVDIPPPSS